LLNQIPPIVSLVIYGPLFVAIYFAAALLMPENRIVIFAAIAWLQTILRRLLINKE